MAGGTWPPPVLANRYELGRALGHGGMGSVWQAEDLTLKRAVAVKLIQLSAHADEKAQARFRREAQAAARLSHSNVVTVYDFGVDGGIAFMVMEYLSGPDLATLARDGGALPMDLALDYLEQAAAGLAAAHARGILHRDVKPANLMLTEAGTVKVLDFGIAAVADRSQQLTATSQVIGTLSYLAPERSMGDPASVQSDLYALGCVAVTLLTGKPPFEGTTGQIVLKHLTEAPSRLSALRSDLPAGLDELIDRLLAKDPALRPGTAEEVLIQLRATRRKRAPIDPPVAKPEPANPPLGVPTEVVHKEGRLGHTVRKVVRVPDEASSILSNPSGHRGQPVERNLADRAGAGIREGWARVGDAPAAVQSVDAGQETTLNDTDLATLVRLDRRLGTPDAPVSAAQHFTEDDTLLRTPAPTAEESPALSRPGTGRWRWILAAGLATAALAIPAVLVTGAQWPARTAASAPLPSPATSAPSVTPTPAPGLGVTAKVKVGKWPSGVGIDPSRGRAYVTNQVSDTVSVINTATNKVTTTIKVADPVGVAVDPGRSRAYVTNLGRNTVSVINTATNKVTATIKVDSEPGSVAVDPGRSRAYVTNRDSDTLSVINTATNKVTATIQVGDWPEHVAVDADRSRAYVTNGYSDTLSVINTATNRVTATIHVDGSPVGVAVDPGRSRAYVATAGSNTVSVINTATNKVTATIKIGSQPEDVAVDPSRSRAFVTSWLNNTVSVINTANYTLTSTLQVDGSPQGAAVDSASGDAFVANHDSATVSVIGSK